MTKYSSKDLELTVDTTTMKAHIIDDVTIGVEAVTEESTPFGASWEEHIATGIKRVDEFTVGGYYDDTATVGPNAKFNTLGTTIAIVITWGGTKTTTVNTIVKKYDRIGSTGAMTRYVATLLPTGTILEA